MTDLSISELENLFTTTEVPAMGDWPAYPLNWEAWHDGPNVLELPGVGKVEYVTSYGGEGQGDDYWVVVKLTQLDGTERYFRKDGRYYSYMYDDCFEYSGPMYEVKPKPKTVIDYV